MKNKVAHGPVRNEQGGELAGLQTAALEAAANAIIITDLEGIIVWANPAFEQLTGYPLREVTGQSSRLLKSGRQPAAFFQQMWEEILAGRKWRGELVNRRKDGSSYDEEMTITPVQNARGQITHFIAIAQDITERKRAEAQLSLLAQAVDNSSDLIGMADREGKLVFANRAVLQALGYQNEEVMGKHFGAIMSQKNAAGFLQDLGVKMYEPSGWKGECLLRHRDGSDFLVSLSAQPVNDSQGRVIGSFGIAQDITERKRAEEHLSLLARAVDHSCDMIAAADREGEFIFVNPAFAQALGYAREELLGKPFGIVMSPNNAPAMMQDLAVKMYEPGGWQGECLHRRRDGTEFLISMQLGPIDNGEGRVIGSFGIGQDISERKRAEEALRDSEEQFRHLAENIREVFFVLTPEPLRVAYLSPAYDEIWGRPRQEVYDRPTAWMDSVFSEDREGVASYFARLTQGIQSQMAYRIRRPDGSIRHIEARTFPVRDVEGKLIRIVGIAEDATVRMEKENTLRETHRRLNLALQEVEEQARYAARLTELVDILQSCHTLAEAYKVTASALETALSCRTGALCVTSPSRNLVEALAHWGDDLATEKVFHPEDCWALRRGKVHHVRNADSALRCAHVKGSPPGGYLCIPLAAQGETLGILYLELQPESLSGHPDDHMDALIRRATSAGERISLALGNLRLREALRSQSIRDALTGLFNRRYMEESLERELSRSARTGSPVALLMLDIDQFKEFNDTFGHQAGDTLLRAFGDFLSQRTRGQDVPCRYGGEEFAIILSGASREAASQRAEILREDMKHLIVQHAGETLGKVTFSIGIAVAPEHGTSAEALIHAADQALYRAKTEGRDRVVVG